MGFVDDVTGIVECQSAKCQDGVEGCYYLEQMSTEARKHVLVWTAPEFLQSEGMLRLLQEVGLVPDLDEDGNKVLEAAENTGGFALSGTLVEVHHGAGIWISPASDPGIEIMIPWGMVRSVISAGETLPLQIGLRAGKATSPLPPLED
jgi:hypothetical protein